MSWWTTAKGWFSRSTSKGETAPKEKEAEGVMSSKAVWIPAEGSRFGVPVLNLWAITGQMISLSKNPAEASMSVSWSQQTGEGLDLSGVPVAMHGCALRYRVAAELPPGLMFSPRQMEEKWVIAWRDEKIVLARSWTGAVSAIGHTRREGPEALVVERIDLLDEHLALFGDPIAAFDWLIRTHALGEVLPLPTSEEGAALLEQAPLRVFGPYGHKAMCAAVGWRPPPQEVPLRTDGALVIAVREGDLEKVRVLVGKGASLSAPSRHAGATALLLAVLEKDTAMVRHLLSLGADPSLAADRGFTPFIAAVTSKAPQEILQILRDGGADIARANVDGFGALHAAAEVNHAEAVPFLVGAGLDLEARTALDYTPLHIAVGLGHPDAVRALAAAGADLAARSPVGDVHQIAAAEGHAEVAALLQTLQARPG